MTDYPITPTPELVQQWKRTAPHQSNEHEHYHYITLCAAQWGADQELEACIDWISVYQGLEHPELLIELLRAARRPRMQSLKEKALKEMDKLDAMWDVTSIEDKSLDIIRRALEALPND